MTKHLFLDYETMDTDVNKCAIIDMSMLVVDTDKIFSDNPYTLNDIKNVKKLKVSVQDQVSNYGYTVSNDTIDFWKKQPQDVRQYIKPLSTDLTVSEYVDSVLSYLDEQGSIQYWWTRSNSFDPIILWRIFSDVDDLKFKIIKNKLKHFLLRDIRTFIDAKLDFPKENGFIPIKNITEWNENFKQHNSSWDVLADALRFQTILRAEADMEQI